MKVLKAILHNLYGFNGIDILKFKNQSIFQPVSDFKIFNDLMSKLVCHNPNGNHIDQLQYDKPGSSCHV